MPHVAAAIAAVRKTDAETIGRDQSKFLFFVSGRAMKRSIAASLVATLADADAINEPADLFQMIELDRPAAVRTALLHLKVIDERGDHALLVAARAGEQEVGTGGCRCRRPTSATSGAIRR